MEKQKCKSKRDALQTRVGQLHQKLERMKLDLQDSEVFKKLDALDQKARVLGQNIYTVADCTRLVCLIFFLLLSCYHHSLVVSAI